MARRVVLSAKLEPQYIEGITKVAKARGISRSQLLREFAANAESLYEFLETERRRQQTEKLQLDGNLSQWVLEHVPHGVTAEMLDFLGNIMKHAAEMKRIAEERAAEGKDVVVPGESCERARVPGLARKMSGDAAGAGR